MGVTTLRLAGSAATVPGTMSAPALAQISQTQLSVTRAAAPAPGAGPITSYDLRYSVDQSSWTTLTAIASPQTLSGLAAGTLYYVQTRAVNGFGPAAWSVSASLATVSAAPVNTGLPVLSGILKQGNTLSATTGTWTNAPTGFAYQWNRAGSAISGATTATYLLVSADVGTTITCSVTATNAGGSNLATSAATSAILIAAPVNSAVPTISGATTQGSTLSATTGTWSNSPTGYTYQWNRAGSAISGATSSTYGLVLADVGTTLTCAVTATNAGGSTAATSAATATITASASVPAAMAAPTLAQIDRTSLLHTQAAAPSNGGSAITSYDLRYSTDQATWTTVTGIASPATVASLTAGTVYFMQTRAVNAIGAAAWSPSGSKDTVFDYSLYNEAGSTTIAASDLGSIRVNIGAGWVTLASLSLTAAQDVAGEILISGFSSSGVATTAAANGIHFEQQITGEPYSAADTVATANTTGTSIRGLHYLQTGLSVNNTPQPGFPLVPTREFSPVIG